MKTSAKVILSVFIFFLLALSGLYYWDKQSDKTDPREGEPSSFNETPTIAKSFTWRYADGMQDLDGFPKTLIYLDITYENGKIVSEMVDEVQGSCYDVDPSDEDKDKLENTTKIQCYAAGFGEWYKVVKGDDSYEVHRKHFAETGPDEEPPAYEYETVKEFPFLY